MQHTFSWDLSSSLKDKFKATERKLHVTDREVSALGGVTFASTVFWDENIFPLFGGVRCINVSINGGSTIKRKLLLTQVHLRSHVYQIPYMYFLSKLLNRTQNLGSSFSNTPTDEQKFIYLMSNEDESFYKHFLNFFSIHIPNVWL